MGLAPELQIQNAYEISKIQLKKSNGYINIDFENKKVAMKEDDKEVQTFSFDDIANVNMQINEMLSKAVK